MIAGKTYTVSFSAKTTGGSNTARGYLSDNYNLYTSYFTNTMAMYYITFTCLSPGATYLSIREMSASNVVTITNFSLVEVDTTWKDLSGYGNNGTLINGPTYDYTDNSLVFDGTNDYVSVADNSSIDTPSTPFTYELYLKLPASLTADTALTHKGSGGFVSWFGSNNFRTAKDGGGLYWCSESISTYLNKVIHITYGFDGVNTFLYFN